MRIADWLLLAAVLAAAFAALRYVLCRGTSECGGCTGCQKGGPCKKERHHTIKKGEE